MSAIIRHIGSPLGSRGGIRSVSGFGSGSSAPVAITLLSPSNWTLVGSGGNWSTVGGSFIDHTELDPLGTNTASLISTVTNGFTDFFATASYSGGSSGVLLGGQQYSLTGYIQAVAGPVWASIILSDFGGTNDYIRAWLNTSTGAAGAHDAGGGATFVSFTPSTVPATTPTWYKFVLVGTFSINTVGAVARVDWGAADSSSVSTSGQAFNTWGWGA